MKVQKKKIFMSFAALMMGAILFCAVNASAEGVSIAVLDMEKAVFSSDLGKAAQIDIEKKFKELQGKFKKDEDALQALQDEIAKKSSVWSDEKKQEKAIEFQKMRRDLRTKQDDANLELKQLQEKKMSPIAEKLDAVVKKYAKDKGYTIVLPHQVVLYAVDTVDITADVTKALNAASK